ncbi:MAG: SxtJ family membrane protein [Melioribacteraceae bacterium]
MSWIKDVAHEIKELDVSEKSLRKFGFTVGIVFLVFGLLLLWKSIWINTRVLFITIGGALILGGYLIPNWLKYIYKIWMGFAFALGWVISRFILIILFVFVLTPLAIIANLFGKKFLDLKFKDGKNSYWIPKEKRKNDYEKMF